MDFIRMKMCGILFIDEKETVTKQNRNGDKGFRNAIIQNCALYTINVW